ncbi:hypothetical protein JK2ML_2433 [Mycobacterium leprae Kyoto-2]|uniref:Uncharacterized protein ML2433 n=3 Tax=Mycobacterium leprae TaxID=1769 RepID=Y2433_MYCLE|nr:hypothetical protein [Mycobacterium leprae]P54580.2 RecName: Full=Uncharacterized protein ML2433 [Mycobacterium leprae TN]CAR72532.1 conserved membrane protein [Mycobacterium leprae Br4923]AWV48695.1 hypothetical protein DIJ64_13380 [Mycobacterium leprae]OAR20429.1 hypothetical protein A8144_10690 [Mycobacterium leprae 3125609]OAX70720.1 hypothetical protein A3216_10160 [Mycobacterium leprae 7935681]CAC31950.1 conserved membrane protein [Mycobacterium leprae]
MTGPHNDTESPHARPISVAELLARNGTIGAPAVSRRRRRRTDSDAVTVAELTCDIPIIHDDHADEQHLAATHAHRANIGVRVVEPAAQSPLEPVCEGIVAEPPVDDHGHVPPGCWSAPEPRWPKSPPLTHLRTGLQRSACSRPLPHLGDVRHPVAPDSIAQKQSDAEGMSPDPVEPFADIPVDVMGSEVRAAELVAEESAYARYNLQMSAGALFSGHTLTNELAERRGDEHAAGGLLAVGIDLDEDHLDLHTDLAGITSPARGWQSRFEALWRGSLIVLQSILAVVFGAGLFVAFDQLWRWNSIVALVLSVLVILGLVVGVRVVRRTEDIASTLIAVVVGALITLGPLALSLQSG